MDPLEQEAIKGAGALISDFCKISMRFIAGKTHTEIEKIKVIFEVGFQEYIQKNIRKYSSVKTLLHRYQPINIKSIYSSPNIMFGKKSRGRRAICTKY
ncbi:hypothetical protein MKK70_07435 [Methylobacterium sp. E-041]|uniref:hypothetical protein n=1 Tax=Methylobacterium sp. E-041 TaxID=2836573 RepID=UPI001FB8B60C|nr:hypothetical protein [Methylobacterium sp. E-041]MCJ2105214.1 hypothetical protein [Methylobacterium sp. E-041]